MVLLVDASAIARNVGRDLVFPASRRAACSHSDLGSCKPRILRFHTRARSHTRFWGRKHDGRWGQKTRYPRLIIGNYYCLQPVSLFLFSHLCSLFFPCPFYDCPVSLCFCQTTTHRRHLTLRKEREATASSMACTASRAISWTSRPATGPSRSLKTSTRQVACGICGTSASHDWSPVARQARISGIASKLSSPLLSATPHNPSPYLSSAPSSRPSLCLVRAAASLGTSPLTRVTFRRASGRPFGPKHCGITTARLSIGRKS
jgi:hypothetical protein